jgi:hypothetical protein
MAWNLILGQGITHLDQCKEPAVNEQVQVDPCCIFQSCMLSLVMVINVIHAKPSDCLVV